MDTNIYAVLMKKNIIDEEHSIVYLEPKGIELGNLSKEYDSDGKFNLLFIPFDENDKKKYLIFGDKEILESNDSMVAAYCITEKRLCEIFNCDLGHALQKYHDYIFSSLNIGVYNPITDSMKMIPVNFKQQQLMISNRNNGGQDITINDNNDEKAKEEVVTKELSSEDRKKKKEEILDSIKEPFEKLNSMVGLENVKDTIKEYINNALYYRIYSGLSEEEIQNALYSYNINSVFLGDPGCGKTTVAGYYASILAKLGYIKKDHVSKLVPADFVGQYVGHSEKKTQDILDENKGGLIIIDEAYQFSEGETKFSRKVIPLIIKEMEKQSDSTLSIKDKANKVSFFFAGYKKEMDTFLKINSGLRSRISNYVEFDNYSKDELYQIFLNNIGDYKLLDETEDKILDIIGNATECCDYGNARFSIKLMDTVLREHRANVVKAEMMDNYILTPDDISSTIDSKMGVKQKTKKMGF